jgi:hypothetical protein
MSTRSKAKKARRSKSRSKSYSKKYSSKYLSKKIKSPKRSVSKMTKLERKRKGSVFQTPRSKIPVPVPEFKTSHFQKTPFIFSQLQQSTIWKFGELYVGWFKKTKKSSKSKSKSRSRMSSSGGLFTGNMWKSDNTGEILPVRLSTDELEQYFIHPELCKGDVQADYVRRALRGWCTDIFILFYPDFVRSRTKFLPAGFLMGYKSSTRAFYVDIICVQSNIQSISGLTYNKHSGTFLITMVEDILFSTGIREVQLSALPVVLTYYPRLGYRHRKSCDDPPDFEGFNPNIAYRLVNNKASLPRDNLEAIDDQDYRSYMVQLSKEGYGASSRSECTRKSDSELKILKRLIDPDINCQSDGFTMRKCMTQPSPNYSQYQHLYKY